MEERSLVSKRVVRFQKTVIVRENDGRDDGVIDLARGDGCWHTIQQDDANRRSCGTIRAKPHSHESIDSLDLFDLAELDYLTDLDFGGLEDSLNKSSQFFDEDSYCSDLHHDDPDGIDKITEAFESFKTANESLWEKDDMEEQNEIRDRQRTVPKKLPITQMYVCSRV